MQEFNSWCSEYSWLVTFISVVFSGFISWFVSFIYYKKGNTDDAIFSIIEPIFLLIKEEKSVENLERLKILSTLYAVKYLKKSQKENIHKLVEAYSEICSYNDNEVTAGIITKHYIDVLKQYNVNVEIEPIYNNNGDIADKTVPHEMLCILEETLIQNFEKNLCDEYDKRIIEESINEILQRHSKCNFLVESKIDFFKFKSYEDVIKESDITKKWDEKFERYKLCKEEFINDNKLGGEKH